MKGRVFRAKRCEVRVSLESEQPASRNLKKKRRDWQELGEKVKEKNKSMHSEFRGKLLRIFLRGWVNA